MNQENEKERNLKADVIMALVYSVLLIGCTVYVQGLVHGYLDDYEVYVGGFIVSLFSFVFAVILGSFGKLIINLFFGRLFLSKFFVIFSCIFAVLLCLVFSGQLLVWWITALLAVLGIVLTFFKKLFMREAKKRFKKARQMEHDLRHDTFRTAEEMKNELKDRFRKR